jgi:hypothetical protein
MNLTMFSPLIMASNSCFRRILHNSFSFTGPYIFHKIYLSNTAKDQKPKANNLPVLIGLKAGISAFNIMGMFKFNYDYYMTE